MKLTARIHRLRRSYLRNPTRATLRLLLISRAKRAVRAGDALAAWDPRMCTFASVPPEINEGCKRAAVRGFAKGLIPTSTKRAPRFPGDHSFHTVVNDGGEGLAIDLGNIPALAGTSKGRRRLVAFQREEHRRQHQQGGRIGGCDLVELIGPDDKLTVLRDAETDLVHGSPLERQHDTPTAHVHEAYLG